MKHNVATKYRTAKTVENLLIAKQHPLRMLFIFVNLTIPPSIAELGTFITFHNNIMHIFANIIRIVDA